MLAVVQKLPLTFFDSLAEYPPWFVAACVTVVTAGAIWVLIKLLKWALWLALLAVLVVGAVTVVSLLLN